MALEVESRIASVTLYARGARIRRVTALAGAPEALEAPEAPEAQDERDARRARVRIVGLPAALIDETVRIETEGGAIATAVHVGLEAPAPSAAAEEESQELRTARLRVALADTEVERLDAALAMLAAAPVALPARGDEPPPVWGSVVDARRALVALRAERELALRDQGAAARRAADEARRALAAAVDRDRLAGSGRPARLHELRKHVEIELAGTGPATLHLEYQVAAARWSPGYVARLDGERVTLALRAMVAQDTGEDWSSVALRLSTAEPERFGVLPELHAQRIGRRQAEPARSGFRAPPEGAAALFLDYLRAFPDGEPTRRIGSDRISGERGAPPPDAEDVDPPLARAGGGLAANARLSEPRGKRAPAKPMSAMPAPMALPAAVAASVAAPGAPGARGESLMRTLATGVFSEETRTTLRADRAAAESPAPPRLDYASLRMAPPGSDERGTLVVAARDRRSAALDAEVALSAARVAALGLPAGYASEWPHTYDYAFATDGMVDVPSDGAWHSIAVTAKPCTARLRHVAVPREQADAFRIATLTNPLLGPLLPGPIDVYDRGSFVVTSSVEHTPAGATVQIGLGVDPAVKLARNTEFREETTGVLRGGLRLHHAIKVDVENLSERAVELEVRERLPVTREDDDDVEVVIGRIEPIWERFTPDADGPREPRLRGGYRWRLSIPPGARRALRAAYEVRIAGKHELVGGNRRES